MVSVANIEINQNFIDNIDEKRIKEISEEHYRNLQYYCSEAIVRAFIDELNLPLPDEVVAMASGFPLGFGQAGCACGAITGGIMILGYFFGRTKPQDTKIFNTFKLVKELHDTFKEKHNSLCCRVLTKEVKFMSKQHMAQCISFTGEVAEEVAKMVKRELSKEIT
ncbi:MAG: C_GCAxxG_C_C family protein [archaeon]|nr:C_GCAxxG_C_C family protein [archaeon]